MNIQPPAKPEEITQRLITYFTPVANTVDLMPQEYITLTEQNQQSIFILIEGELSVLRASDGLLVSTLYTPNIVGLSEMLLPVYGYLLRAETENKMLSLNKCEALKIIQKNHLWHDVAMVLAYNSASLFYRNTMVIQPRTYFVVRNHLQEMMTLSDDIRMRITILDYIQERTHLSRSSILNVLAVLKNTNHIMFKRGGYLTHIVSLPENL